MPSRGGGGFGGGGHSGGFSGGHSGGFRGGHSGGFRGFAPPPPRNFYGSRPRGNGCGGCGCLPVVIIGLIVAVAALFSQASPARIRKFRSSESPVHTVSAASAHKRLPDEYCTPIGEVLSDEAGILVDDVNVEKALDRFYDATGVQPYLLLTDTVYGTKNPKSSQIEDLAFEKYAELFDDEGHLLLVYVPFTDYLYDFYTYYLPGDDARAVFDDEAGELLIELLDAYAPGNGETQTVDEMWVRALDGTVEKLNIVPSEPSVESKSVESKTESKPVEKHPVGNTGLTVGQIVWTVIGVIAVVSVAVLIIRRKRAREAEIDDRP